ncbi:RING finger protein 24 isoform 1-T1 [Guaruba guarouba]
MENVLEERMRNPCGVVTLPTHELGLPALQFQDAEHRVPEPASQHIHRGFRHGHLRLHPQFALLLLFDQAQASSTQRALRLQTGYTQGEGEGAEPTRDLCRLPGGVQAQGRAGDLSLQTCLPQKVPHQVAGGAQGLPALQHAGAAAGAAAQAAGPRPPPGPPARCGEHCIAPAPHGPPHGPPPGTAEHRGTGGDMGGPEHFSAGHGPAG